MLDTRHWNQNGRVVELNGSSLSTFQGATERVFEVYISMHTLRENNPPDKMEPVSINLESSGKLKKSTTEVSK